MEIELTEIEFLIDQSTEQVESIKKISELVYTSLEPDLRELKNTHDALCKRYDTWSYFADHYSSELASIESKCRSVHELFLSELGGKFVPQALSTFATSTKERLDFSHHWDQVCEYINFLQSLASSFHLMTPSVSHLKKELDDVTMQYQNTYSRQAFWSEAIGLRRQLLRLTSKCNEISEQYKRDNEDKEECQ